MVVDPLVELPEKSEGNPVSTLERRVQATWTSLAQARLRAQETREMLGRALESACSSELSIVVYGSLARNEFTEGSDVDWTLLIDGPANYRHLDTAHDIEAELQKLGMKEPSREGAFGAMTFSHDLVHQIGFLSRAGRFPTASKRRLTPFSSMDTRNLVSLSAVTESSNAPCRFFHRSPRFRRFSARLGHARRN
jgi:predicted nucleotidyltransferase